LEAPPSPPKEPPSFHGPSRAWITVLCNAG